MYEFVLHYCDSCGFYCDEFTDDEPERYICPICQCNLKPVPKEYTDFSGCIFGDEDKKRLFMEKYVKSSPNFNQYYFDHKDEISSQQIEQFESAMEHSKAIREGRDIGNKYGVTCPYCHATNVSKIGYFSRSLSTGLFGLGSKKIGKQWHCDHCGSDF